MSRANRRYLHFMRADEIDTNVREIKYEDIPLIADYWLNSDSDHLLIMGVDLKKLPSRTDLIEMLKLQIDLPLEQKKSYALIWNIGQNPIGHCNVTDIAFAKLAYLHLHIWDPAFRIKGLGTLLLRKSIPLFFERLQLESLVSEPYSLNPAPHKALKKVGFRLEKTYETIPGSLSSLQEVKRWVMLRSEMNALISAG